MTGLKNVRSIVIVVTILHSFASFSQSYTQIIKGTVFDADSRVPLAGTNIQILGSDPVIATISDLDGYYRLENVPLGRQTVKATYVGYEQFVMPGVPVTSGKEIVLDVAMKESVIQGEEVTIELDRKSQVTLNTMTSVSGRMFSVEESKRFAGGFYDPARMAESFAGVASFGGEDNELIIRGNSPRGLLWRLEGVEIPNPNHFPPGEGATGGGVAIITSNVIANSDFLTGAFPAEYGNALSGVFDINLRKGNDEKHEFAFQASIVGFEGAAEGPILAENGSYLLNYRIASFRLLDRVGISVSNNNIVPFFQDIVLNIQLPGKKAGRFSLFGFGGNSTAGNTALRDSSQWVSSSDREEMTEINTTGVLGLKHFLSFPAGKTYLRSVIMTSYEKRVIDLAYLENDLSLKSIYNSSYTFLNFRFSSLLHHKISSRQSIRGGVIAGSLGNDIYRVENADSPEEREVHVDFKGRAGTIQAYIQHQLRAGSNLEINYGLHGFLFLLNSDHAVEPRLGLSWKFKPGQTLNAGFGLVSRHESISIYTANITGEDGTIGQPNRDLDLTRAFHTVFGYNIFFRRDIYLKTELYYQYLYNVPVIDSTDSRVSILNYSSGYFVEPLSNGGTGRNYGLELTLEKYFTDHYYFLFTGSLFDSRYVPGDGKTYNTLYNGNYIFNILGGKDFPVGRNKQDLISINGRFMWKGGNRITPILLEESREEGRTVYDTEKWMEDRVKDFLRLDAGVSYRRNKRSYSWILSADIQNVTDRKNIFQNYYNEETGEIEHFYLQGFLPILNFRLEFGIRSRKE